ncbi:hypothetical protein Mlute_01908 [Meiothermus luteus]|jgi:hypothetical protein|uniref:Uncharacterized protein n=1 Tax=Meiothermus luteus TaxID=2026184 RepID=A0A399EJS4_9DEIN|nr:MULTISPECIES: hypothetical protein [Meiothermus]MCL6530475.1 hypothetical protein [Meiothermus ruber]RIH84375.1 hypothetical protein Mlute_01908 [Meiothermus luteus]
MRPVLFLLPLLLSASAQHLEAQGVMDLPDKAVVSQFGENQLLEFRPRPDGSPRDYLVYGLTRRAATPGEELRPLLGRDPVPTAPVPVRLRTDMIRTATVEYQLERVAYLRVRFTVSGVERAGLYRNGRLVAGAYNGIASNFFYGLAWAGSFGLISLFGFPTTTSETYYHERIPVSSTAEPITLSMDGGGYCPAASSPYRTLTINPANLRAGYLYDLEARFWCEGGATGMRAEFYQQRPDYIGWRVYLDGRLVRDPHNAPLAREFVPTPHPDYSRYGRARPLEVHSLPSLASTTITILAPGDDWIDPLRNPGWVVIRDNGQYILAQVESGSAVVNQRHISWVAPPNARVTSYQENTEIVRVNNQTYRCDLNAGPEPYCEPIDNFQEIERTVPQYGLTEEGVGTLYTVPDLRLRSLATCTPLESPEVGVILGYNCGPYGNVD